MIEPSEEFSEEYPPHGNWQIIVAQTRFMGYLEGGAWAAFASADEDGYAILRQFDEFDEWDTVEWFDLNWYRIGLANNPNDAVRDLIRKQRSARSL
jgi:hypothetical protein